MDTLRVGKSYWLDCYWSTGTEAGATSRGKNRAPRFPRMRGHQTADVAIVGSGITGSVAAYLFARAGARVVLIDAERVGRGSTAASTAMLMQEPDVDFRGLAARYGVATAVRIWRKSSASVAGLIRLVRTLRIDAGHRAVPSIYWSADSAGASQLRRELARRHAAGLAGRWLSPQSLKRAAGIDGAGAILTRGGAQIDPYRACLGMALAARQAGARVFERSAALSISGTRTGVEIELERGHIRADWAVIATGYATPQFKPLAARFRLMDTYVIATPPLTPDVRANMGLGDAMLWSTERPYHYARWTPDGRLLFGGEDRPHVPRSTRATTLDAPARALSARLAALYPVLDGVAPEYAWGGLFATTPDGLPYIGRHRRYPRQLFALGYGGNGMTFGFMAAELLVRAVAGTGTADDPLFGFSRG